MAPHVVKLPASAFAALRAPSARRHGCNRAHVCRATAENKKGKNLAQQLAEKAAVSLGPIGLTLGGDIGEEADGKTGQMGGGEQVVRNREETTEDGSAGNESINSMTTEEWRAKYEDNGMVDLWLEDEFNAASRMSGGRAGFAGYYDGWGDGEGAGSEGVPVHTVEITNHFNGQNITVEVPEDRFILMKAEEEGLELPYACRMGCCTACAVRVTEGEVWQPYALGVARKLKEQGYALMCVAVPLENCKMETVAEDEVYEEQFGKYFRKMAMNPDDKRYVDRDDFAMEIALGDE